MFRPSCPFIFAFGQAFSSLVLVWGRTKEMSHRSTQLDDQPPPCLSEVESFTSSSSSSSSTIDSPSHRRWEKLCWNFIKTWVSGDRQSWWTGNGSQKHRALLRRQEDGEQLLWAVLLAPHKEPLLRIRADCAAPDGRARLLDKSQTRFSSPAVSTPTLQSSACEFLNVFWFLAFSCSVSHIYDGRKASLLLWAGVWKEVLLHSFPLISSQQQLLSLSGDLGLVSFGKLTLVEVTCHVSCRDVTIHWSTLIDLLETYL